jgi:hypothetical protein
MCSNGWEQIKDARYNELLVHWVRFRRIADSGRLVDVWGIVGHCLWVGYLNVVGSIPWWIQSLRSSHMKKNVKSARTKHSLNHIQVLAWRLVVDKVWTSA